VKTVGANFLLTRTIDIDYRAPPLARMVRAAEHEKQDDAREIRHAVAEHLVASDRRPAGS
jgi:hypothetical protein